MPRATSTPKPEPVRGEAGDVTAEQLPQGGAATVEAGLQQAEELAQQNTRFSAPEGVNLTRGQRSRATLDNPDDQFLYGPTQRPEEPIHAGMRAGHKAPPPEDIMNWLPYLQHAATQPGAPQELKNLLREIVYSLGG